LHAEGVLTMTAPLGGGRNFESLNPLKAKNIHSDHSLRLSVFLKWAWVSAVCILCFAVNVSAPEAQEKAPDELKYQEKALKLQKDMMSLEKTKADIINKNSETARNVPEVEHLKSETILNMAKAREASSKVNINTTYQ